MSWHMRWEWNLLNCLFLPVQLLRFAMVSLCDSQYRPEHLSLHRQGCISAANSKTPSFKYGWDFSCSFSDTPQSTSPGHAHPPTHTMPQKQAPQAGEQKGVRLHRSCLWAKKIQKNNQGVLLCSCAGRRRSGCWWHAVLGQKWLCYEWVSPSAVIFPPLTHPPVNIK